MRPESESPNHHEVTMSFSEDNQLSVRRLAETPPDVDALVTAMCELLTANADQLPDNVTRSFFENFYRIALDWMATGEHDHLRQLLEHLQVALASSDLFPTIRKTDARIRLMLQFQAAGQFLATFLRTSNLTRVAGLLAGARKRSWRKALAVAAAKKQPLALNAFVEAKVFDNDKTAYSALQRLVELGFVARTQHGSSVVYELTWPGYVASKTVSDIAVKEPAVEIVPPNVIEFSRRRWASDDDLIAFHAKQLREQPSRTAMMALHHGVGILPGTYLSSGVSLLEDESTRRRVAEVTGDAGYSLYNGVKVFQMPWLDKITQLATGMLDLYAHSTGGPNVIPRALAAQPHDYEFIAAYIASGRATLPQEILFKDDLRRYLEVAELFLVTHMRALVLRGGEAEDLRLHEERERKNFLEAINDSDVRLCAPFNTAAHHYLWIASTEHPLRQQAETRDGTEALGEWLLQGTQGNRMLLCDTGIAADVVQYCRSRNPQMKLHDVSVPYPQPLAAGIAYSSDDPVWGAAIH